MHMNMENNEQQCESENGYLRSDNAFGSVRHVVLDELFKGASIRASFGGTVIDLRHTHLAPGETYIDIDCTCSGIELYIPSDWNVLPQCNAFAGGCEDKRWQGANINKESTLIIRGNISFGGLEIKDKSYESTSNHRLPLPLVSDACAGIGSGNHPGDFVVGICRS